jgi:SPP1 family predicted phage head-tail adaptor
VSDERVPPIGTLTDRVQLLHKSASSEDEGGEIAVFTPIATVWARVRALGARAAFEVDARGQAISHSVVTRFRTDVGAGDRVVYRGRTLEVVSAADLNGRRAYLSCRCVERVVTG